MDEETRIILRTLGDRIGKLEDRLYQFEGNNRQKALDEIAQKAFNDAINSGKEVKPNGTN